MKTIRQFFPLIALLSLLGFSSCDEHFIRGNGIAESEFRYSSTFEKVKSSGEFDVHITSGDEFEVMVNAESNLLQYIDTRVVGNSLVIDVRGFYNLRNRLPMEVYITTPNLEGIKQSGSGNITTDYFYSDRFDIDISGSGRIQTGVECEDLEINVSGSGQVQISGTADFADLKVSGSGKIYACELEATNCSAKISGSGDICIYVDNFLDATISGSGTVFYRGNPSIESHISGSGKIIPEY